MNAIQSRKDIYNLVCAFYAKIRKDNLLGPIFNGHIPDEKWSEHLKTLTDFWDTKLFGSKNFKGNPSQKHINVDKNLGYSVEQKHFGRWLQIWFETIDELYQGQYAEAAKELSRRMATGQFMMMFRHRPQNNNDEI